jgi:hypothetical protein
MLLWYKSSTHFRTLFTLISMSVATLLPNFPLTRSLGFEGGKVELRAKVASALHSLLAILVPRPTHTVLPTNYMGHSLCGPILNMGNKSPDLLGQWFQPVSDFLPSCPFEGL